MLKYAILILAFVSNLTFASDFIWFHEGNKRLNHEALSQTISEVVDTLPSGKIPGMKDLVWETLLVETRCGEASYTRAARDWKNYGIAQIRADTSNWVLKTLFKRDRRRFGEVYKYYNPESSMEQNLLYNVPFSIAICAELYALRLRNSDITTLASRAQAWKTHYNTVHGVGTVKGYISRIQNFRVPEI